MCKVLLNPIGSSFYDTNSQVLLFSIRRMKNSHYPVQERRGDGLIGKNRGGPETLHTVSGSISPIGLV